jgi:hypothetical protein
MQNLGMIFISDNSGHQSRPGHGIWSIFVAEADSATFPADERLAGLAKEHLDGSPELVVKAREEHCLYVELPHGNYLNMRMFVEAVELETG